MKNLYFLFLIHITVILTGCIVADELIENKSQYKGSLEIKVKKEIVNYLVTTERNYEYFGYGYSELIINKPIQLIELDSLKKIKTKTAVVEQKIKELETKIKKENINYTIQIDHFYQLKHKINKTIELFETRFFLNDSIKIKNTKPLIYLPVSLNEQIVFSDFFYETPIFKSPDFYQSQKISSEFYRFFKNELEHRQSLEEKSAFLNHIIWVCQEVKEEGSFNIKELLINLTIKTIKDKKVYSNYIPVEFSELFETRVDNTLANYYFFHKFIHLNNNDEVVDGVRISFSPYYEVIDVVSLKKPLDQYFDDKN